MLSRCRRLFPVLLLTLASNLSEPALAFPSDPSGGRVLDRFYDSITVGEETIDIYAVMYAAADGSSKVDIYRGSNAGSGTRWAKLHTWQVQRGSEPFVVLTASSFEGHVNFAAMSSTDYVEGRATPTLEYNPVTGQFHSWLQD